MPETVVAHARSGETAPADAPHLAAPEGIRFDCALYLTNVSHGLDIRIRLRNCRRVPMDFAKMVSDAIRSAEPLADGAWRLMTNDEILDYQAEHGES